MFRMNGNLAGAALLAIAFVFPVSAEAQEHSATEREMFSYGPDHFKANFGVHADFHKETECVCGLYEDLYSSAALEGSVTLFGQNTDLVRALAISNVVHEEGSDGDAEHSLKIALGPDIVIANASDLKWDWSELYRRPHPPLWQSIPVASGLQVRLGANLESSIVVDLELGKNLPGGPVAGVGLKGMLSTMVIGSARATLHGATWFYRIRKTSSANFSLIRHALDIDGSLSTTRADVEVRSQLAPVNVNTTVYLDKWSWFRWKKKETLGVYRFQHEGSSRRIIDWHADF